MMGRWGRVKTARIVYKNIKIYVYICGLVGVPCLSELSLIEF